MLKFIDFRSYSCKRCSAFQNILCWSLSKVGNRMKQQYQNFKTSYVEVYPFPDTSFNFSNWFQNILCWSLSRPPVCDTVIRTISKHLMLKFIPHFLVTFISFYLFSPSFFLISIIFTKHQPIFFFLSNISQIPRLYNTFSTFFFFSPGKYFYNSQSGMGCSSDVFTTENAWS